MVHSTISNQKSNPLNNTGILTLTSRTLVKIFLLNLAIFTSCKKYELEKWVVSYPQEVETQMNLFLDYAPPGLRARPLTIKLSSGLYSNGRKASGLCSYKKKTIYLDTTSVMWHSARTRLVMHELGHYVIRREHLEDTTTLFETWQGFPVSFMKLGGGKPSDWNLKREDLLEYYMEELFNPSLGTFPKGG